MSVYVVPAILALILKLFFVYLYRRSVEANPYFIAIVVIFAFHNLSEVLVLWEFFAGVQADFMLRTYYLVSIISLLTLMTYATSLSSVFNRRWTQALWVLTAVFGAVLFSTDLIVAGVESIVYSATAIRGEFYAIFQVFSFALLILTLWSLYRGYISTNDHDAQNKCAYTGLALVPHVVATIIVVVLMNLNLDVNAAMVFPLATTLFIFILLASEDKHRMTDIRRFIPFSEERQTSNEIMEIFSDYARDRMSYREAVNDIEKLLVEHKYQKTDFNASSTAQLMGMPRSSLYSLFNRLGIKRD